MPDQLNTSEAAQRMNVGEETVRDLCRNGHLAGALQSHDNGPWLIPTESITSYISNNYRRRRNIGGVLAIIGVVSSIVSIVGFFGYTNYCTLIPSICTPETASTPVAVISADTPIATNSLSPTHTAIVTPTLSPVQSATLESIHYKGFITAGVRDNHYPFSDVQDEGAIGFDIDIVSEFARRWLNDENAVHFKLVNVESSFVALAQKDVDLLAISLPYSEGVDRTINFSQTYLLGDLGLLVRKDNAEVVVRDLDSKLIGGLDLGGLYQANYLEEAQKSLHEQGVEANFVYFEKIDRGIKALIDGDIDAFVGYSSHVDESETVIEFVHAFRGEMVYGFGLSEGDAIFQAHVNSTLEDMKRDGTYARIYNKWFPFHYSPRPINLLLGPKEIVDKPENND